jgi:LacI family transcriptional regulator
VKLITTDLFLEMSPYFKKGTIAASIYQQPHRQGQLAVRVMADSLTTKASFPPAVHLSPGVVMSSNLHLFREIRMTDGKLSDVILRGNVVYGPEPLPPLAPSKPSS